MSVLLLPAGEVLTVAASRREAQNTAIISSEEAYERKLSKRPDPQSCAESQHGAYQISQPVASYYHLLKKPELRVLR